MKRNNIILIGMPGCGKSTVGVVAAKMLGYEFLDCDLVIQKKYKKKLWELIDLALPMIAILALETVMMFCLARFLVFRIMGSDYDAAVLVSGFCGFGMGATPNAMANMQSITQKFGPSPKAFLIVPIVGGMFCDLTNTAILTVFMKFLG